MVSIRCNAGANNKTLVYADDAAMLQLRFGEKWDNGRKGISSRGRHAVEFLPNGELVYIY
jgi:hypothetical protein